jgi:DNA-binding NtrC family response regulator
MMNDEPRSIDDCPPDAAPRGDGSAFAAPRPTVLVVDDTPANLDVLVALLERRGYEVMAASSGELALRVVKSTAPQLILLDVMMPGLDGYAVCRRLKADPLTAKTPVIFISAREEAESVVAGFAAGAVDYIGKPLQAEEVVARVEAHLRIAQLTRALAERNEALERRTAELTATNGRLNAEVGRREQAEDALRTADDRLSVLSRREVQRWGLDGFVGQSGLLRKIVDDVRRVANFGGVNVLITGESGTGKELVARAIHAASARRDAPFIPINCGAVPADLAESMFFGHVRGAFTGATGDRKGYFELADGGTLFLDEIGDMPPALQAKLLRVLEDNRVMAVGGTRERRVDVRVVAATNADLRRRVSEGAFRQDLYFRLAQFCVEVPPLRERPEDIPLLSAHFVRLFAEEMGFDPPPPIEPAAAKALAAHPFPGNVRELKNVIERALIDSGRGAIKQSHLHLTHFARTAGPEPRAAVREDLADLPLNLEAAEHLLIRRALTAAGGNIADAARRLGINRARIYRHLGPAKG